MEDSFRGCISSRNTKSFQECSGSGETEAERVQTTSPLPPARDCTPPAPSLQPGWTASPCSWGISAVNPSSPGQPWRNKTRQSITLASSHPSLHCAEPEGLHIKAGAAGCRGVPSWLPECPSPRRAAPSPRAACLHCPHGLGLRSLPEPRQQSRDGALLPAPGAEGDVRGHGGCREHQRWRCTDAGTTLYHSRAGSTFHLQGRAGGGIAWGERRASPIPSLSWSCGKPSEQSPLLPRSSRYPHKTLLFAVPSMPHGRRFPQAAAPLLLQTVH